jgi:hypothetical protein
MRINRNFFSSYRDEKLNPDRVAVPDKQQLLAVLHDRLGDSIYEVRAVFVPSSVEVLERLLVYSGL